MKKSLRISKNTYFSLNVMMFALHFIVLTGLGCICMPIVAMEPREDQEESELLIRIPLLQGELDQEKPLNDQVDNSSLLSSDSSKKIYKCNHPDCFYVTASSGSFYKHKKKHTGVRQYKCDVPDCGYAAIEKYNLTEHKKKHTEERARPYKCDSPDCGYAAARSSALITHKKNHTGENLYKCDFPGCRYAVVKINSLTMHKKARHMSGDTLRNRGEKRIVPEEVEEQGTKIHEEEQAPAFDATMGQEELWGPEAKEPQDELMNELFGKRLLDV